MPDHPTTVDHTPAKSPATDSSTIPSTTPTSAVRVARIGGTIAELAAAAISAHTLYHLGGQLDLGPWTAWLLPAALDIYAFTALAIGYSLPAPHPGQKHVLRNARLAFAMTLSCNFLDHFLQKAGRLVDPTIRDLLLVAVATLPPLVVERLLNLQSLLIGHRTTPGDHQAETEFEYARAGRLVGQGTLAHKPWQGQNAVAGDQPRPSQSEANATDTAAWTGQRLDWTVAGAAVFTGLSAQLGRRPSAREFQTALTAHTRTLIAEGRIPAETRPPSITTTKRVRAALENPPRPEPDGTDPDADGPLSDGSPASDHMSMFPTETTTCAG